ncbi:hypothetical protein QFZ75_001444 [Streptomyces sp. V3I8]|nr:hypothetical protein [Streptomyces sp. V3I8]
MSRMLSRTAADLLPFFLPFFFPFLLLALPSRPSFRRRFPALCSPVFEWYMGPVAGKPPGGA